MGKFTHQPFDNWLLSEEPLAAEQEQELREHLQNCESCQQLKASWSGVEQAFQASSQAAPTIGFTARWQQRFEEERHERQQRQTWFMLGTTATVASFLFFILSAQALQLLRSPSQLLLYIAYRLMDLFTLAETTGDFFYTFLRTVPRLLPLPVWILSLGVLSILGVLWIVFYQSLSKRRIKA